MQAIQTITQQAPATALESPAVLSSLSSLASSAVAEQADGHWGDTEHGWDFIPNGKSRKVALRPMTDGEKGSLVPLLRPAILSTLKGYIARLALRKRPAGITPITAPMFYQDLAADLQDYSELAVLMAFRDIRRRDGDWMPKGDIPAIVREWQGFVDDLFAKSNPTPAPQIERAQERREETWTEDKPEQKAKVGAMLSDFYKTFGSGGEVAA